MPASYNRFYNGLRSFTARKENKHGIYNWRYLVVTLALKNTTLLTVAQLINALVPFLFIPYYSRIFDAENFRLVMVSVSIIQFSTIITDFGFNISAVDMIVKARSKSDLSKILSGIYIARLAILTLLLIPWTFFVIVYPHQADEFLILLTIAIFFQVFQAQWLFLGLRQPEYIIYASVMSRAVFAFTVFIFVHGDTTVNYVAFATAMSAITGALVYWYLIFKSGYKIHAVPFAYSKSLVSESAKFFWSRISVAVYSSLTSILVASSVTASSYAIYSVAEQLYKGGQILSGSVSQAILPETTKSGETKTVVSWAFIFAILGFLGVITSFAFGEHLLVTLFGPEFADGYKILQIFAAIFLLSSVSVMFGYPFFAAKSALDIANNSVYFGALVHCCSLSLLYFTKLLNIYSVGFAILLTEFCILLFRIIYIKTKF